MVAKTSVAVSHINYIDSLRAVRIFSRVLSRPSMVRGYEFSSAGNDTIERGHKLCFRVFDHRDIVVIGDARRVDVIRSH